MHRDADPHQRHKQHVIRELARQAHVTVDVAQAAYEEQLAKLEGQARVKTYLPVLATKRAREALARRH